MRLKPKNLKKLASLSALGAGALAMAPVGADAGTIDYVDLSPGIVVTAFEASFGNPASRATLNLLGSAQLQVLGYSDTRSRLELYHHERSKTTSWIRFGLVDFALNRSGNLGIFGKGQKWTSAMNARSSILIGTRFHRFTLSRSSFSGNTTFSSASTHLSGNSVFANQYALFRFSPGSGQTLYGWLELSYSDFIVQNVTLEGYAFDTSGAYIAAGDTGASSVPEPSSFELTGLAALALGAAGVRRWKAARKADKRR